MEDVLPLIPRDGVGDAIEWRFRFAQEQLYNTIQLVRAFGIVRSSTYKSSEGALSSLASILGLYELPRTARETTKLIVEAGVDEVLQRMQKIYPPNMFGVHQIYDHPVKIIIVKPRQVGISTLIEGLATWFCAFRTNAKACVIAHEGEAASNVLNITSTFLANWREEACEKPTVPKNNTEEILFGNGSKFQVKTSGSKDIRSFKFDFLHLSEFAFYERIASISAGMTGIPKHCWTFIESTANGKGGSFHDRWLKAVTIDDVIDAWDRHEPFPDNVYVKFFTPWFEDPEYQIPCTKFDVQRILDSLTDYEASLRKRFGAHVITPERLKWRRARIDDAEHDVLTPEQFVNQEYPADEEEAFQTAGSMIFDMTRQKPRAEEAAKTLIPFRVDEGLLVTALKPGQEVQANLVIFDRPRIGHSYVIGIDPRKGMAHRDADVISVFDRGDDTRIRQVAEFRGWIDQNTLGELAVLLAEMYNDAWIIFEINEGYQMAAMIADRCQYSRFYSRQQHDGIAMSQQSFRYGFLMSSNTKRMVIEQLKAAVRDDLIYINSLQGVKEMAAFTRDEKGNYGAPSGQHDDCVITYALAWFGHFPSSGAPLLESRPSFKRDRSTGEVVPATDAEIDAEEIFQLNMAKLSPDLRAWVLASRQIEREMEEEAAEEADIPLGPPPSDWAVTPPWV